MKNRSLSCRRSPTPRAFRWPEPGYVAFEPAEPEMEAHSVRESRVEFPNAVTFLRVSGSLVVAEPVVFTDPKMRLLFERHVARYADYLRRHGLAVVADTIAQRPRQGRPDKLENDASFGELLLREFIVEQIDRRDARGCVALTTYIEAGFPGRSDAVIEAASQALARLIDAVSSGNCHLPKALRQAGGTAFFRALRDFLAVANGGTETMIDLPETVAMALASIRR